MFVEGYPHSFIADVSILKPTLIPAAICHVARRVTPLAYLSQEESRARKWVPQRLSYLPKCSAGNANAEAHHRRGSVDIRQAGSSILPSTPNVAGAKDVIL